MQPKTKSCLLKIGVFVIAMVISWQFWMNYLLPASLLSQFERRSTFRNKLPDVEIWQTLDTNPKYVCVKKPGVGCELSIGSVSLRRVNFKPRHKIVFMSDETISCNGQNWTSYDGELGNFPQDRDHYLVQIVWDDYYLFYKMDISPTGQSVLMRASYFMPMTYGMYGVSSMVSTPIIYGLLMLIRAIWLKMRARRLAASG